MCVHKILRIKRQKLNEKKIKRREEKNNLSIAERKLREAGHEVNHASLNLKGSDPRKILFLV
ncbi:MAG: hypothetical protein NT161_03395 [Candidatus Nomurabacteria bacterium]|nr:hypothetical protein [Candidatus Nomurabacteria bacterium]